MVESFPQSTESDKRITHRESPKPVNVNLQWDAAQHYIMSRSWVSEMKQLSLSGSRESKSSQDRTLEGHVFHFRLDSIRYNPKGVCRSQPCSSIYTCFSKTILIMLLINITPLTWVRQNSRLTFCHGRWLEKRRFVPWSSHMTHPDCNSLLWGKLQYLDSPLLTCPSLGGMVDEDLPQDIFKPVPISRPRLVTLTLLMKGTKAYRKSRQNFGWPPFWLLFRSCPMWRKHLRCEKAQPWSKQGQISLLDG